MTYVWNDLKADAEADRRARAAVEDRQRHAVARLLHARGQRRAAALVAISGYTVECFDAYGEPAYEVRLAVPPAQFDVVDGAMRTVIADAAAAVSAPRSPCGLELDVRLPDDAPGWDEDLLRQLFAEQSAAAASPPTPEAGLFQLELPSAENGGGGRGD